jgi:hypothetical protein
MRTPKGPAVTRGEPEMDRIGLWNRYLTPTREAGGMQNVAFLPGVDPKGVLRGMTQEDGMTSYVHTEDNQVHFILFLFFLNGLLTSPVINNKMCH